MAVCGEERLRTARAAGLRFGHESTPLRQFFFYLCGIANQHDFSEHLSVCVKCFFFYKCLPSALILCV